ncbi:MAG: hypothetical protein V4598_08005 [Bdellovibrionota bacterium]
MSAISLLAIPTYGQESYPVLRPENCSQSIVVPKDANAQLYMSKDCRTAFILPRENAVMKISSFRLGATVQENDCDNALNNEKEVQVTKLSLSNYEKERVEYRRALARKLESASPDETSINAFKMLIDETTKSITETREDLNHLERRLPYSEYEGALMNVHMSLAQEADVNAYREANKESGIRFQAARISSGLLSFVLAKDDEEKTPTGSASILDAKIAGLGADGKDRYKDSRHLIINGGAGGYIKVAQPTICSLIRRLDNRNFNPELLTAGKVTDAGFVASYLYDVPVTTKVDFKLMADTSSEDVRVAFKARAITGRTTQDTITRMVVDGKLANSLKIEFSDGGRTTSDLYENLKDDPRLNSDAGHLYSILFGHAMEKYDELVLKKLETMKLIQEITSTEITPIEGQEVIQDNVIRECKRGGRNVFGKRGDKKCKNVVYHTRVFVPGVANVDRVSEDNTAIKLNYDASTQETFTVKHSSSFLWTEKE